MLDMKDIDKIHTSADGADSFMDKAKEEESTLKKLVLLHSHATTRLAQLAAGEKEGAVTSVFRPSGDPEAAREQAEADRNRGK